MTESTSNESIETKQIVLACVESDSSIVEERFESPPRRKALLVNEGSPSNKSMEGDPTSKKDVIRSVSDVKEETEDENLSVECFPSEDKKELPVIDTADLQYIAAELSNLKPRVNTDVEEAELTQENHRITLGSAPDESTGSMKSHRRPPSLQILKTHKNSSHKIMSLDDLGGIIDSINDAGGGSSETKHKRPSSLGRFNVFSTRREKEIGYTSSATSSRASSQSPSRALSQKNVTLLQNKVVNYIESTPSNLCQSVNFMVQQQNHSTVDLSSLHTVNKCDGTDGATTAVSLSNNDSKPEACAIPMNDVHATPIMVEIRSSEQDPSLHQTSIPSLDSFLYSSHLCYLLDCYRRIDQNFDFTFFLGMNRLELESYRLRFSTCDRQKLSVLGDGHLLTTVTAQLKNTDRASDKKSISRQQITQIHMPIFDAFLTSAGDLTLEGFYHELAPDGPRRARIYDTAREKSTQDRMEVAIFSSEERRQIIVVYQGSIEAQTKPMWNSRSERERNHSQESLFSKEQPVNVLSSFKSAYFHSSDLEGKVFRMLDNLINSHPFFDVIMTGHSFGGVLATLSSMRYASSRPMLLVSCFTYSCPKIGDLNFRYYVNSLPNLKIMRMESKIDPRTHFPEVLTHAGHAVVFEAPNRSNIASNKEQIEPIKAYRFGNLRPPLGVGQKVGSGIIFTFLKHLRRSKVEKKDDNTITAYVAAIERIAALKLPWPIPYVGEGIGVGVNGMDDENRLVV